MEGQVAVKSAEVPARGDDDSDSDGHDGVTAMLVCVYHATLIHAARTH
jgi:hypothetical protein